MKKLINLLCAVLIFAVTAAGCAKTSSEPTQATGEKPTAAESTQASTESGVFPANVDSAATYEYEVREIWCENNGKRIYGEAYIPVTDGRSPLVIHSHGLGSNHEAGASYGKKYAKRGIAVYAFDFPGGSNENNENRSDGTNTEMSVMTEVSDVTAILNAAKTWDFVDTDRIFLQGGSQGGLVTAIAGIRHQDEIAGLILHYPAFAMPDFIRSRYASEPIPDEFEVAGMTLGRIFAEDLMSYDVREDVPNFKKPVLIIQGGDDKIVLPSVTAAVGELYPDCEYRIIDGAAHGFSGEAHDEATKYALDFIYRVIGV